MQRISLTDIERETYKNTLIHSLDGRIKLLFLVAVIIYIVSLPKFSTLALWKLAGLEIYLILLILIARLNLFYVAMRFVLLTPFGLGIAIMQPFFRQGFITEFTVRELPLLGLTWTEEGLLFGTLLFAKCTVAVTTVILFSSTSPMTEMVESARRLKLPREFALLLTMMIRYLFVFWGILNRLRRAQESRCFDIWNKNIPRKWILEQIGYSIGSLFIRSYEQGERTFQSMLSRGYDYTADIFVHKKKIQAHEIAFIAITIFVVGNIHFLG
ncbi:MAG: cobalt ECF transporter T component CbiQ [Candidatus Methanoperedens sp.]|nr:cobalt ECF transporter T component CbiQ [Candidatus Methanoperedens sp.]